MQSIKVNGTRSLCRECEVLDQQMNANRILVMVLTGLWPHLSVASPSKECSVIATVEHLLNEKHKHDQKPVCAIGLLRIQLEGNQLSLGASKVWLEFYRGPEYTDQSIDRDEKLKKKWERLHQNQCVVVRGRFSLKNTGHFGVWPAGIEEIGNITRAPPGACGPSTSLNLTRGAGAPPGSFLKVRRN